MKFQLLPRTNIPSEEIQSEVIGLVANLQEDLKEKSRSSDQ